MKALLSCLTASLLLATASPTQAAEVLFKVSVNGTVQTQTGSGPTDRRIHTAILNEKRILQEYGVSSQDYALGFGPSLGLQLVPKRASAMLPTFTILTASGGSVSVINTKAHFFKLEMGISKGPASTTIFNNVAGELVGTEKYKGTFPATTFTKFILSAIARGTDPSPGGNGQSLLKFKLVTGADFVQQP